MKPEPGSVPPRIWVKPTSGLWAASPINPDQWTSDVDVARFNIYISLAEHEAALQKANAEVERLEKECADGGRRVRTLDRRISEMDAKLAKANKAINILSRHTNCECNQCTALKESS